ncbi:MAG: hypothetical protein Q6J68_06755, partial [Thermostichales cyanobacterium SZTDM-1c_bins_54]
IFANKTLADKIFPIRFDVQLACGGPNRGHQPKNKDASPKNKHCDSGEISTRVNHSHLPTDNPSGGDKPIWE